MSTDFTFAVCAYKDSQYLEDAVKSARQQTYPVDVLIATSTPSDYIKEIAGRYDARYCINPEKKGIAADWNFALSCANTPYVTIAHQDDVYLPEYAKRIHDLLQSRPDILIAFSDYGDLLSDGKIHSNRFYLMVKRLLLWAYYLKNIHASKLFKHSTNIFGNAICCPAVTYNLNMLKTTVFSADYSVNLDWDMWIRLSEKTGAFAFVPQVLMGHRIADAMETAAAIADNRRYREDFAIFERIWGRSIANVFMKFYQKSYIANTEKKKKD